MADEAQKQFLRGIIGSEFLGYDRRIEGPACHEAGWWALRFVTCTRRAKSLWGASCAECCWPQAMLGTV